ncbi:MAG: hypothetical protein KGR17_03555 [Acidobacteria bacterium]|nr:hypothetical protein [Acidobacteriota bacterium]
MDEGSWIYDPGVGQARSRAAEVHVAPDGSVDLDFDVPGPAGTAVVSFPDGSSWTVDEADPSRLVAIHLPDRTDRAWRIVRRLLGPGADELQARAEFGDDDAPRRRSADRTPPRPYRTPVRRSGGPMELAALAGAMVVSADVSASRSEPLLVRIAAAVTLAGQLRFVPELDVFDPVDGPALDMAEGLAPLVRPEQLDLLREDVREELSVAITRVAGDRPNLGNLARRLLDGTGVDDAIGPESGSDQFAVAAMMADFPESDFPAFEYRDGFPDLAAAVRAGSEWPRVQTAELLVEQPDGSQEAHAVSVEWVEDLLLRVAVPASVDVEWIGVLRASDLLQMAFAPVAESTGLRLAPGAPDGGSRSAAIVVPSGYSVSDLRFVAGSAGSSAGSSVDGTAASAAERFREAVESGRSAAQLTRAALSEQPGEWPPEVESAWEECARAWGAADDPSRRKLASMYASGIRRAIVDPRLGLPDRVALDLINWG